MENNELMIKIDNVSKQYRLGAIGGGTLQGDLQSWWAKKRGKENPNSKIGAKQYGKNEKFLALEDINIEVKKGERVGIIGHNGAGKSTLLKLLSRVTAPTTGYIGLNGRISSMLEVGTGFHGELTGRENIYMNGAILGMSKKEIDSKIDQIIEFSECSQFIDTPVKRYSSGMYVKLAFAVAAHLDSEILIMDEVLAVGDMAFQKKCLDKMSEVSKGEGRTILYVSHNMNTIRQLCDRVIVLDHGHKIFDGDVEEGIEVYLSNSFDNSVVADYKNVPHEKWIIRPLIKLLRAEFINKNVAIFKSKENMQLKLKWTNIEDINDISLRLEIYRLDGVPVASGLIKKFYLGFKDIVAEKQFDIDITNLAPGKYRLNYVFTYIDEFGVDTVVECVKGLYFEIAQKEDVIWNTRYWGNLELNVFEIDGK